MTTTIYLAGKYDMSKERLRAVRETLRSMGFVVTSSWLDETATESFGGSSMPESSDASDAKMRANAIRDMREVLDADVFLLDTLDESASGGREVELGLAMATFLGDLSLRLDGDDLELLDHEHGGDYCKTTLQIVGPKRNIFHHLAHFHYENWDEALAWALKEAIEED